MFSNSQGLPFQPELGQILICDFDGFEPPEMTKKRPVIVVSPKPRITKPLCIVVALSTKKPNPVMPFHHKLPDKTIPFKEAKETWVKCDMVYTVSLKRLSRIKIGHHGSVSPRLPQPQISKIQQCLLHSLGMHHLTERARYETIPNVTASAGL